jgi:hypothetical protein
MIRQQQLQLQQLQATHGHSQSGTIPDESAIASERSGNTTSQPNSAPQSAFPTLPASGSFARSPGIPHYPRSSFDMARADLQRRSRTPSRGASPRLRSTSISQESGDHWVLGGRDESAFYQAETQMLTRENQMLRHRIRDLGNPQFPFSASYLKRLREKNARLTRMYRTPIIGTEYEYLCHSRAHNSLTLGANPVCVRNRRHCWREQPIVRACCFDHGGCQRCLRIWYPSLRQ